MSQLSLSVVIPTYNRSGLLGDTLHALTCQTMATHQFEVVIVDDGSSDDTAEVVTSFAPRLNLRYFWQPDKGFRAAKARNIGTAIAEGKYIVYVDAGVSLASHTLDVHLRNHANHAGPTVLLGYVYGFEIDNALVEELAPLLNHRDVEGSISVLALRGGVDIRQQQYDELGYDLSEWPAPYDIMWTCHMSAERDELMRAGLFDERFNTWGGEDVDLGVRLFASNNAFRLERSAVSVHWPTRTDVELRKRQSASAGRAIHAKYGRFETSLYGSSCGEAKFSLNKAIQDRIRRDRVDLS
jgi:glycosyltransferase involved in cell wall biosynthesis